MRKILGILLVLVVLAAGGLFVYQQMRAARAVGALETIIPDDTIYYFYSYAPSKKIEALYNSNFYQKLANLSAYKQFAESSLAKKQKLFSQLAALFDSDAALAVFSVQGIQMQEPISDKADIQVGKFLLFIRTSAGENIKTILGDFFLRASEKQETTHELYGGIKITHYALTGSNAGGIKSLSYAQLGDVFVLGDDQERLKRAIDLFKGSSTKSLANNSIFQALEKERAPVKNELLLWNMVNYKKYCSELVETFLKEQTGPGVDTSSAGQIDPLRNFFENFMGVMVGVSNTVKYDSAKQGLLVTTNQLFDAGKDENGFLETFAISTKESNPILTMVPADALGYIGFCGNMTKYFNYFKRYVNSAVNLAPGANSSDFSGKTAMPETVFGVNLEKDVLPLLGGHFALFLSDIEEISMIPQEGEVNPLQLAPTPIPQIFLVAEAKDTASAERFQTLVINTVISSQSKKEDNNLVQQEEPYKDIVLHITPFEGTPIRFVCFVIDKYLVFGTSLAGAKKIIDTKADIQNSLASDLKYSFDEKQLLQNSSYVLFLDFAKLIKKIAGTKIVQFIKPTIGFFSQGKIMPNDVDAIFGVLGDINLVVQVNRVSNEGVGEGLFYIGVNGLN